MIITVGLVARMLRRAGVEPLLVTNGEDAVRQALSETVKVVLMDRHMPRMDGVEATQLLRKAGFRRPIIAFTAGDQAENEALLEAGCDGVLNKPIDQAHLQALLDRYLPIEQWVGKGSDEDIGLLVNRFLDGLAGRKQRMETAFAQGELQQLQSEVHQIRGTAGAMGYPLMTEQAGVLEQCVRSNPADREVIRQELNTLNAMIDRALEGYEKSSKTTKEQANER